MQVYSARPACTWVHTVAIIAGGVHLRSGSLWENRRLIFARMFSTVDDMVVV